MTPGRSLILLFAGRLRGILTWQACLLAAVVGLAPIAARATDAPGPYPDRDIPAALRRVVMLSDADATAQKGTGFSVPTPSIGLLQGPTVRLWDELRVLPQTAPNGTVTITIGRPGQ